MTSLYIVDDSEMDRYLIKRFVEKSNRFDEIYDFTNGEEAIDSIVSQGLENIPDIILLDINMPIMDGFQFLEKLTELRPDLTGTSVFMLTSSDHDKDREKAIRFPAVKGYFIKPFKREYISELLND